MNFTHPLDEGLVVPTLRKGITSNRQKLPGCSNRASEESRTSLMQGFWICANNVKEDQMVPEYDSLGIT